MSKFDLRDISDRLTASRSTEAVVFEFLGYLQAQRGDWRASLAFYEVSRDALVCVYERHANRLVRKDISLPVDRLPPRLVRKFFHSSAFFNHADRRSLLSQLFHTAPCYEPDPTEIAMIADVQVSTGSESAAAAIERLRTYQPAEADTLLAALRLNQGDVRGDQHGVAAEQSELRGQDEEPEAHRARHLEVAAGTRIDRDEVRRQAARRRAACRCSRASRRSCRTRARTVSRSTTPCGRAAISSSIPAPERRTRWCGGTLASSKAALMMRAESVAKI